MNTLINVNNLLKFREEKKLSQRDVAAYLDISQAQYWKHETGKSILNANQIIKLCELYNVSPNDLLGWRGVYEVATKDLD